MIYFFMAYSRRVALALSYRPHAFKKIQDLRLHRHEAGEQADRSARRSGRIELCIFSLRDIVDREGRPVGHDQITRS